MYPHLLESRQVRVLRVLMILGDESYVVGIRGKKDVLELGVVAKGTPIEEGDCKGPCWMLISSIVEHILHRPPLVLELANA